MSVLPFLLIPGAAIAVASNGATPNQSAPPNVAPNGGVKTSTPSRGSLVGDALKGGVVVGVSPTTKLSALKSRLGLVGLTSVQAGVLQSSSPSVDAATQEILDTVDAYGEAAYNNMSKDAKKAGAKALSDTLKLDPPLSGDEDWETIAKIAGGAAGAAAFGWAPGGAVWGPIVGAYFGVKLEVFLSGSADDVKKWFKSRWSQIENWVKGEVGDVADAVGDFFGHIF